MKDDFSGVVVDGEVGQFQYVGSDDHVGVPGELRIFSQLTDEHDNVGRSNRAKANFGDDGLLPGEHAVEVEGLRRLTAKAELTGDLRINDADRGTGIESELQMGLRANLPFYLNQRATQKMKREFWFPHRSGCEAALSETREGSRGDGQEQDRKH